MTLTALLTPNTAVLEHLRDGLIRDEVRAGASRRQLERAAVESIRKMGASVDEVSAATGLTPTEIRRLLDRTPAFDLESDELSGAVC